MADPDCLFCRIAPARSRADRVHEDDLVVAFRDIAPRAPTHVLLMPRAAYRLGRRADRGRRADARPAVRASPPTSPGPAGIADGGYRLVSNVGAGAARPSTISTST